MLRPFVFSFCCLAGMATAQAPLWLANCSNQADASVLNCEVAQSIVLTEGNRRVATAAFLKAAGGDEVTGVFTLPIGLFLPSGLVISVDEAELGTLEYRSCDAQGCYATGPVPQEWQTAMQDGSELVITIERPDRQPLNFTFPLEGFSDTFSLLP